MCGLLVRVGTFFLTIALDFGLIVMNEGYQGASSVPSSYFWSDNRLILQGSIFTGMLVCGPFIFLMPVGRQIMGWSPVKGSQRELVGSMLMDLGILGGSALNCFILIPAMVLSFLTPGSPCDS
jgi:hypothetical protein